MRTRRLRPIAVLVASGLVSALPAASTSAQTPPAPIVAQELPGPSQPTAKDARVPEWDPATVLVKFKAGASSAGRDSSLRRHGATAEGTAGATGYTVARLSESDPKQAVRDFEADPEVQDAELNFIRRATATPNDPGISEGFQAYLSTIRSYSAWNQTKGSTAKMIAILDTGIDTDHPDLAARIRAGYNALNGGTNTNDDNGHGTFVAGVAGAITNNARGIAGSAWLTGLQPIKVLDADGLGTDADIADGITWAADRAASVLNLSLAGPGISAVLKDAIEYALSKDKVVVAAAGNDYAPVVNYPAAYPGVVAVTATDNASTFAHFSNFGNWVDVAAPGTAITSTLAGPTELYATGAGTSFAAPLVAGVALMVRVKYPTWKQGTVHNRLRDTARDFGPRGFDPFYGKGRLDAFAALGGAKLAPAVQPAGDAFELNSTLDRAKAITGSSVSASISPEGDVDWFYKEATSTGSLTFTVTPPAYNPNVFRTREMDPVLEVYGPGLEPLGTMDQGFLGTKESLSVPVSTVGRYYARVSNFGGSRTPANYTLSATTSASAPTVSFNPYELLKAGGETSPESLVIADVTGDGRKDVVMQNGTYNDPANDFKLMLYAQQASGALAAPVRYGTDAEHGDYLGLDAGDLNGDGKTDVVLATANGIDAFYQSGGTLGQRQLISTPNGAYQVDMADMEGDGDQDLFVSGVDGLFVLRQGGAGSFATVTIPAAANWYQDVRVADMTLDGRPDLVTFTGTGGMGMVHVFNQLENGTFELGDEYTHDGGGAEALAVGDVTGDGRPDAVLTFWGHTGPAGLDVVPLGSDGHLGAPVFYPTYQPQAVQIADMNRDGRGDLVLAHSGEMGVFLQTPAGVLGPEVKFGTPYHYWFGPDGVAVGDLNGDGAVDVASVYGAFDAGLVVLRQLGGAVAGAPLWVRDHTPADFSLNISTTLSPKVEFARALQTSSINASTVVLLNGNTLLAIAATRTYDAATKTITINPTPTLAKNTPYLIRVNGVKDTAGSTLTVLHQFRFKTAA